MSEKTVEELETEYQELLDKKIKKLADEQAAVDKKVEEDKKIQYEQSLKEKWEAEYKEAHAPVTKIDTTKPETTGAEDSGIKEYFNAFGGKVMFYEHFIEGNYTDSDAGCDVDVSSWSPADIYANIVWGGLYDNANLFQVCVKGLDIKAGDGLTVQLKTIGKFADPTEKAACGCVSCASASLGVYSLTMKEYGMETEVCNFDVFEVGEKFRAEYLKAFGKTWGDYFNSLIWTGLTGASPGLTETLGHTLGDPGIAGSCCTDSGLLDMYNAINAAVANRREANYNPDYVIMSPTVASIFKRMQTPNVPIWVDKGGISIDGNGRLTKLPNGLKVIEYSGAQTLSSATATVFAVMVDSSRAYGTVMGKKPTLEKTRDASCNSWTYDMWSYFANGSLDIGAIIHIVSPNA